VATNRLQPGAVLALLFAFVYLLFPTRNYYWDGVSFAIDIEHAQSWRELFNVHHLLYNFIGYGEYQLLGSRVRALYLMQWTNCIAGALLIWLADRLFRSLGVPPWNSAAGAAILGASATFWKFTTDADSYILANVFLAAAYLALRRSAVRGGLLHVCATMMHQLSALFYPVGLALLWRRSRERFWRDAAIYTLVSAGGTLAVYAAAFRLAVHRAPTFAGWLTFHAKMPFSFDAARNAGWLLLGTGKLFAGGKLSPTAYLVGPVAVALLVFAVAGLANNRRRLLPVLSDWPLLVWVGAYLCFLLVWEPYNTFYRLFYLAPLLACLALAARATGARPLAFLAAALACWNFWQFIYPKTQAASNAPLAFALKQRTRWPEGTGVIFGEFVPDLWTISYFNPQVSWIPVEQPDAARVSDYAAQFARDRRQLYVDWTYLQKTGQSASRFHFQLIEPASALNGAGAAQGVLDRSTERHK
jgi:hypothetical protein